MPGPSQLLTLPRLLGSQQHRIDYRHLSWSLVRKPGAFAHYRHRDDLFPSVVFRQAYDALSHSAPGRAEREYVRILHLAASTVECEVEAALTLLLEHQQLPLFDTFRDLVRPPASGCIPALATPDLDLRPYDRLLRQGAAR